MLIALENKHAGLLMGFSCLCKAPLMPREQEHVLGKTSIFEVHKFLREGQRRTALICMWLQPEGGPEGEAGAAGISPSKHRQF